MWFRRDLRLNDHPALNAAAADGAEVVPVFVIDPRLWDTAGYARRRYLLDSLTHLDASMGHALVVRRGDPVDVIAALAAEVGATNVHISADFGEAFCTFKCDFCRAHMRADWLMALTPGGVDQDLQRLPYDRIKRPMYPLDPDMADPDLRARMIPLADARDVGPGGQLE